MAAQPETGNGNGTWKDELQTKVETATGNKTPGKLSKKSRTKKNVLYIVEALGWGSSPLNLRYELAERCQKQ